MGLRARGVALVLRGLALGIVVGGGVVLTDAVAIAKSSYDSPYGYEKTWNAALRLVRVDLAMKVLEKDDATGYILFEYRTAGGTKPTNGSFELIRGAHAKSDDVRVILQLPQMPRYHEQVMLDELAKKMRDDYGEPPEPRERTPAPPDAGPDAGEEYN